MTDQEILDHFRQRGALLDGHFVLRSGMRSRTFFQCALALQQMPDVERFAKIMLENLWCRTAKTVMAPAMGGLVLGQEVARQMGARFVFAEKVDDKLCLRRGFKIDPGEVCLVVEDVITRGGRVKETLDLIRGRGGVVEAILVLVDRSSGKAPDFGAPLVSLLRMNVETYPPDALPEDLECLPAVKPGS